MTEPRTLRRRTSRRHRGARHGRLVLAVGSVGVVAVLVSGFYGLSLFSRHEAGGGLGSEGAAHATSPTSAAKAAPRSLASQITPGSTVVTIGDSIMAGYGLDDPDTSAWPARLGSLTKATVVNDSCSGGGFIAAGSCGTDFGGLLPLAASKDPDVVIIQSSDNDFGQDEAQLATATSQTVQALRLALPNAVIIGLSTLWDQPGSAPAQVAQSSSDLETAVLAVGGTFVDVGQPIAGQAGMLQDDSEHPTDQGQEALVQSIFADLKKTTR